MSGDCVFLLVMAAVHEKNSGLIRPWLKLWSVWLQEKSRGKQHVSIMSQLKHNQKTGEWQSKNGM